MKIRGRTFKTARTISAKALIQVCSQHRKKMVTEVNEKAGSDRGWGQRDKQKPDQVGTCTSMVKGCNFTLDVLDAIERHWRVLTWE